MILFTGRKYSRLSLRESSVYGRFFRGEAVTFFTNPTRERGARFDSLVPRLRRGRLSIMFLGTA